VYENRFYVYVIFEARCYAYAIMRCPSVLLSVTFVYCVKTRVYGWTFRPIHWTFIAPLEGLDV